MTRRISLEAAVEDRPPHLKEIAGRLRKLSYREMLTLAAMLGQKTDVAPEMMAAVLLAVSDEILGDDA